MTVKKAVVLLDYCSFYIAGADEVRVPLDHDLRGVVASDDCINVSALPWNEGTTAITLGRFEELPPTDRFRPLISRSGLNGRNLEAVIRCLPFSSPGRG